VLPNYLQTWVCLELGYPECPVGIKCPKKRQVVPLREDKLPFTQPFGVRLIPFPLSEVVLEVVLRQ
jgi:hypothetical protein